MSDTVAGGFALIVVLALVGGVIGTIAPSLVQFGRGEPPTRKKVAGLAAGVFIVAFVGFAITVPELTPEQKARAEAEAKADALRVAEAEKSAKATKKAALQKEIEGLWNKITAADGMCSESAGEVGNIDASDRYAAYSGVSEAMQACKIAHSALRELDAPRSLDDEHQENFETAIGKCADASLARQMMFEAMLKVIDGDMRPSSVQAVKEAGETGQAMSIQCVAMFVRAANEVGVEVGAYIKD